MLMVGGFETIADAIAAAVGAATAVPIAAAVGGVKVETVAAGSATGTGLVVEAPCNFPEPSMLPISVADVGAVTLSVPTEGLLALMEPEIGNGLAADTA